MKIYNFTTNMEENIIETTDKDKFIVFIPKHELHNQLINKKQIK